jgi:hypothetical protein
MKTIIVIAALAISGSCFATPGFEQKDLDRDLAIARAHCDRMQKSEPSHLWDAIIPNPSASQSSKVDFTIVTLPDGKTATALTIH